MAERAPHKQAIIDRVIAALDYLPDDPEAAHENHPWFAAQLDLIVRGVTHRHINVFEEMAAIAVLGLPFSRQLNIGTDPPGPRGSVEVRRLRAI